MEWNLNNELNKYMKVNLILSILSNSFQLNIT